MGLIYGALRRVVWRLKERNKWCGAFKRKNKDGRGLE